MAGSGEMSARPLTAKERRCFSELVRVYFEFDAVPPEGLDRRIEPAPAPTPARGAMARLGRGRRWYWPW